MHLWANSIYDLLLLTKLVNFMESLKSNTSKLQHVQQLLS